MQVSNEGNIGKRSVLYLSKNISKQLSIRDEYQDIIPTIMICITKFNFLKRNSYHSIAKIRFEETTKEAYVKEGYKEEQEELTDVVEMHFIELPKFIKGNAGIDKKIEQWLWLISGKGEKIEMAKKKNNKVEEAMNLVKEIMQDPKELEIYESIQKARMDYNSGMRYAREEGEKKRQKRRRKKWKNERKDRNS